MSSLGQLLSGGVANKIEALYDDVKNTGLLDPVGTSAYALQAVTVKAENPKLAIFDLTANLGADSSAQVTINAPSSQITPFDASAPLTAPAGSSYAQLHIDGNLSAGIAGSVSKLPLSLSANATATFDYDHYLPAAAAARRIDALTKLVATAQLPQFESLTTLAAGEISRFTAELNFDLGIQAKYGSSFAMDQVVQLFDGLSGQIKFNVQYSIQASLGWSVFDTMTLVVAKAQQNNPNWVRIRLEREHKNSFTAGATFALQVDYDASSIGSALEKAFQMSPLPRAIDVLTTVSKGDWATLTQTISDKAADDLIAAIAGTGWKQKAATSPEVTKALAEINTVVSIYNSIDTKVQQLWSELLTRVDLQPGSALRKTIDTIAAIDPENPNLKQFLTTAQQKDIDMLEALTGVNLEQLLIGSDAAVELALTRAVDLAKQLLRVIDDTPATVTAAIQNFTKEHGIQSAIQWLSANATSLDKIEAAGDAAIQKLVTKLVGKAFDQISTADLQKVQAWATRILAAWDDLTKRLQTAAQFLKGTLGFSASLEFSRASESSALLDFEVDPANGAAINAVTSKLPSGSVRDMLAALDAIPCDDQGNLPYSIRESILVSRKLRNGVTTVLLSLLGLKNLQKVTGSRFEETIVHISNTGRDANFAGGFTQGIVHDNATSQCGAWINVDAKDDSIDPNQPFATVARSMHLTFSRNDTATTQEEVGALTTLLADLGFFAQDGAPPAAPAGAETAFTMEIVLDETAVAAFATDDGVDNWNNDFRNAAYRLLRDDLVADSYAPVGQPLGEVLALVVKSDLFGQTWTDTSEQKFKIRYTTEKLKVSGKTLPILDNVSGQFLPPFIPIKMTIKRRPNGFGTLGSLRNGLAASQDRTPASLTKLAAGAAATFANTVLPEWDNPMFNFWLVVARLCRLGPAVLQNAKGFATFRSRTSSTAAFSNPTTWSLTTGVSAVAIKNRQLFPFA